MNAMKPRRDQSGHLSVEELVVATFEQDLLEHEAGRHVIALVLQTGSVALAL